MKLAETLVLTEPQPDMPPDAAARIRACNRVMRTIVAELDTLDDLATAVFVTASLVRITTELAAKIDPERARCALAAATIASRVVDTTEPPTTTDPKAQPS